LDLSRHRPSKKGFRIKGSFPAQNQCGMTMERSREGGGGRGSKDTGRKGYLDPVGFYRWRIEP
jgi:hypothetical protein